MSNKSGTVSQHISLPQGGGAVQGIGEKFSPDLHTGTGNFTVPLALPPGRNSLQPHLSLSYSTGSGNGPFGLGWGISIPGVSRKTAKGVPRYNDTTDVFLLSGAEDLVPVSRGSAGVTRYRPRTEGLFARIDHHHDQARKHDHWEVWSKDGLVSVYGTPGAAGNDPAVVADPDLSNRTKVFAWQLTQTRDSFGNRIVYDYERDLAEDGPHHWDQLYLSRIRYADYVDGSTTKFMVSVTFVYEDRPDPFSEHRSGFEIRTRKRCTRIEIRTHADQDRRVRTYNFAYLNDHTGNGASLLSRITVTGHDGDRSETLPPLTFSYTQFSPHERRFSRVEGSDLPAQSLASPDLELADLFGNGLPDILEMNGTIRYWRNLGGGRFDRPREMKDAPAGVRLADSGVQMIDADGDGRIDLLVTTETVSGYYPLRFSGLWDRRSFQRYHQVPSFNLEDPEVKLVDLDGDGVTDALRSGSRLECFFNDPKEGWSRTRFVERRALEDFPNVSFSDPRVKLGDLSGDGLQDIVLVYDGGVEYWPSLGHGDWGKRVTMRHAPRFPYGYDPKRILIGDVDGDGLADVVYVDNSKVTLWINQAGNSWSDPIEIRGTPTVTDMDAVRLVDLLGTGVSGVLWSADATGLSRSNLSFLDFTGGSKPYLLDEMDNHTGAITKVTYTPSTRFYVADQQRPATRWKTPLPFPVQVVSLVEVSDALSGGRLTTSYHYHHGYWDGAEREFRGFGRVEQLDSETFVGHLTSRAHGKQASIVKGAEHQFSPPTLTKTWFHQGPIGDEFGEWEEVDYRDEYWPGDLQVFARPSTMADFLNTLPRRTRRDALRALRGSVLRTELYAFDGSERQDRPYTVTESVYGVREEMPLGPNEGERLRLFFPHALAQRTTQWERGDDPMTQCTFTDDHDAYGQPRSQIVIAVPRGRDFRATAVAGEPYLATHTVRDYVNRDDAQRYLLGAVARTTSYEILNTGAPSVFALHVSVLDGSASRRLIGQTLNFYDGPAFEGLPFGQLGEHGIVSRTESLVLTSEILHEAYKSSDAVPTPPELPPYLAPSGTPAWTPEYPQEFRDRLPTLAGYIFQPGGAGSPYTTGYFVTTERRRYDCQSSADGQGKGLLLATRDPLGSETTLAYDAYAFFPTHVTDSVGLTTQASYDYRVLQAREMTDPNGNRSAVAFTPFGLVERTAVTGKVGENIGDTLEVPGSRLVYDFAAFVERGQPVSVRTIKRVHHVHEVDVPLPERDETLESIAYSDGFGRLLQARAQAEDITFGHPLFGDAGLPADQSQSVGDAVGQTRAATDPPRVVVSGWQIYDNKGRVVEKYEPFFSSGFDYAPPTDAQFGQKATMYYDPRGQVIRTANPDGSEQRVIFGVPEDLMTPEAFVPTPWEAYTYDANDNAGRTHAATANGYQGHWNTPASILVNALGRTVSATARNGTDPAKDWFTTRSTYDIQGNLLAVTDALGRVAFRYVYDLAKHPLRTDSIDAGLRRAVIDALENPVEERDNKGALVLQAYDVLHRPLRMWAKDGKDQPLTLRDRLVYGDAADAGLNPPQATAANLLGKLYQHYDEAGLVTAEAYDFKGNALETMRQVIGDAALLKIFTPVPANWQIQPLRVDWQPPAGSTLPSHVSTLLDPTTYRTSVTYDALNRVKLMRYPQDIEGKRKELRPRYNRAGALEQVQLDGKSYVAHIAYNAKGQRTLIAYGNSVMTRHAYDPRTFRLARLRTERYTTPAALTYHPTGAPLQDFAYQYDLAGNITVIHERAPDSGVLNTPLGKDALDRTFTYDPLYRLLSVTGRECNTAPSPPWLDQPRGVDLTRTRNYREQYRYDPAGNLTRLQHQAEGGEFVRELTPTDTSNRLTKVVIGQTTFAYAYDANGNVVQENGARHYEWDYADRMRVFRTQAGNAEPSVYAQYLYDAGGQRVKKLVRKQGGKIEITVYIAGVFEHQRIVQGNTVQQNNTLHVMDNQSRIALVRVGAPFPDDTTPAVKFHCGDHLDSSHLVLDDTGTLVNREEYTPYGETSFGSFARKRYRFTGKERDEENGLSYHGARYYAPWLARWVSCDPAGIVDGTNLYAYTQGNPLNSVDSSGLQTEGAGGAPPAPVDNITGGGAEGGPQDLQQGKETISGESLVVTPWNQFRRWMTDKLFNREAYDKATNSGLTRVEPNAVLSMTDQIVEKTPDAAVNTFLIMAGAREKGTKSTVAPEKQTVIPEKQTVSRDLEPVGELPEPSSPYYHGKIPPGETSAGEALHFESLPGTRIFLAGPKDSVSTTAVRIFENRATFDTLVGADTTLEMEVISREVGGKRGVWWSGTHGTAKGEYGGPLLQPRFHANDVASAAQMEGFKWGVIDVATTDPRKVLSNGGYSKVANTYAWCCSSSMFLPPPGFLPPPKLLLLPPKKF